MRWRSYVISLAGLLSLAVLFGCLFSNTAFAKLEVPAAPPIERPIIDQTESLANEDIDRIAQLINAERQKKSFQIGVLMIPTLGSDDSLEEYSLKVARQWGIGDKKKSNGVLLLIAKNDRKMRIEVGNGIEGSLTDARASQIIRNTIAPKFRSGDYAGGVEAGVKRIIDAAEGRNLSDNDIDGESIVSMLFIVIFITIIVIAILKGNGSNGSRRRYWWLAGGLDSGSSGSSSSGGSFGGGGFSGGGASGGW
ncbi:MAG: TPM domain-containing protein [Candidatus Nanosynbacter sp.]|nr:TPM domain-containing protein [Candidatus Nanosynbacter sp.]